MACAAAGKAIQIDVLHVINDDLVERVKNVTTCIFYADMFMSE